MELLDRIDQLTSLCPCGAEPRKDSQYCSDDCVPTWRGKDTISHLDGTAMRWAPVMPTHPPVRARIDPEPIMAGARAMARLFADLAEAFKPAVEAMRKFALVVEAPVAEPDHPLARMTARRTNLTHGPQLPHRPPRTLSTRH